MKEEKIFYVYILASSKDGSLYTGVTSNLAQRIYEHRNNNGKAFTKKYKIYNLVYYELWGYWEEAFNRKKCIKKWNRQWKINLIKKENPNWKDLYWGLIEKTF